LASLSVSLSLFFQPVGEVLDGVVSEVLNSVSKPEEVVLTVSQSEIALLTSEKEVRLC
jgi:ACT domain-containing protein